VPRVSRAFVRTALACLAAGLLAGVLGALPGGVGPRIPALEPVRMHLLVVGWLTGLVVGVAHWLFPSRGRDAPLWIVYALLYGGLGMRVVAEPSRAAWGGAPWGTLLVLSAVTQAAALFTFAAVLWPRVRGS
jgi:hypothetical protein